MSFNAHHFFVAQYLHLYIYYEHETLCISSIKFSQFRSDVNNTRKHDGQSAGHNGQSAADLRLYVPRKCTR